MIDELNVLDYDTVEIREKLREYFREMPQITEEQVEERANLGLSIFDLAMFLFGVASVENAMGYMDIDYYMSMFNRRYTDIIVDSGYDIDTYLSDYIAETTRSIVNGTVEHIDDSYYTSQERALGIAQNEPNTVVNYNDYIDALKSGAKYKKWISEGDDRVRKTHRNVEEGKFIEINKYFHVGDSLFLFPHDLSMTPNPREYIRCRCHIDYSYEFKESDNQLQKIKNKYNGFDDEFHSLRDPMEEVTGSAFDSHPEEVERIYEILIENGVVFKPTENDIAYSPSVYVGEAGVFKMTKNGSYSAWLHEYQHFIHDKEHGYIGATAYFKNLKLCAENEYLAYQVEIRESLQYNRIDITNRLKALQKEAVESYGYKIEDFE